MTAAYSHQSLHFWLLAFAGFFLSRFPCGSPKEFGTDVRRTRRYTMDSHGRTRNVLAERFDAPGACSIAGTSVQKNVRDSGDSPSELSKWNPPQLWFGNPNKTLFHLITQLAFLKTQNHTTAA